MKSVVSEKLDLKTTIGCPNPTHCLCHVYRHTFSVLDPFWPRVHQKFFGQLIGWCGDICGFFDNLGKSKKSIWSTSAFKNCWWVLYAGKGAITRGGLFWRFVRLYSGCWEVAPVPLNFQLRTIIHGSLTSEWWYANVLGIVLSSCVMLL